MCYDSRIMWEEYPIIDERLITLSPYDRMFLWAFGISWD